MHLGWNVLAKQAQDKLAFIWLALLFPAIIGFGFLIYEINFGQVTTTSWICLFASTISHVFYFWLLTSAYHHADLSFVYPYCRGIGALLAALMGVLLLAERPSLLGGIGILFTIVAIFIEPLFTQKKSLSSKGVLLSGLTGLSIASYFIIDKIGLRGISYVSYLLILFLFVTIALFPFVLKNSRFKKEFSRSKSKPFLASFFITFGYGVILLAMTMAPVSYVVSARATGIVFSALAGWMFFSEKILPVRVVAIVMITLGIIFIGVS